MKNKNFMPKTPREKGMFVGALACIAVFTISFIFIVLGVSIIPSLIVAILAIVGAMVLAVYSRKIINARLAAEEGEQPKVEEAPKAKEPEPQPEPVSEPAPVEEVVKPEPEPVIEEPVQEEPAFEEEPEPVQPVENKKPNKMVFAIVIPIVAVALVAAVAIPVAIHFANNNNGEVRDDEGGNNNNSKNNGNNKVSFNITSTTRYEETSDGRVDGYQFEPNKDYIQYRFILSDAGWYVEWIDYGKWSFDASTGLVSAVCTTYETFNVNSQWTTKTYSEGAANAQKSLKVINDTTLYWNGNSNFVAKKVSNFTHPIVIFQERP